MNHCKTSKKLICLQLVLSLFVLTFCVGFKVNKASAATDEVYLQSAQTVIWSYGGGTTRYGLDTYVVVKNIAYQKVVTIHAKNEMTGGFY